MAKRTVPEKVFDLLRKRPGVALCDDCIRRALSLPQRQQVFNATAAFGLCSDFTKYKGECEDRQCDSQGEKLVTKAN